MPAPIRKTWGEAELNDVERRLRALEAALGVGVVTTVAATRQHASLLGLDFAASGHSGFASLATAQVLSNKTLDGNSGNVIKIRRGNLAARGNAVDHLWTFYALDRSGNVPPKGPILQWAYQYGTASYAWADVWRLDTWVP